MSSAETYGCSGSVSSAHMADAKGKCSWCGRRVAAATPKPDRYDVSELTEAYGYHYDPDYGRPEN